MCALDALERKISVFTFSSVCMNVPSESTIISNWCSDPAPDLTMQMYETMVMKLNEPSKGNNFYEIWFTSYLF